MGAPQPPPRGEREVVREPAREPAPAGGGGPWAVIAAIVGVILVILLIFFLVNNLDLGGGTDTDTAPDNGVEAPDDLDVDVEAPEAPEAPDVEAPDAEAPDLDTDAGGDTGESNP